MKMFVAEPGLEKLMEGLSMEDQVKVWEEIEVREKRALTNVQARIISMEMQAQASMWTHLDTEELQRQVTAKLSLLRNALTADSPWDSEERDGASLMVDECLDCLRIIEGRMGGEAC